MSPRPQDARRYWQLTLKVTLAVLGAWLLVTLAAALWLPGSTVQVFGWPVGFWAASQGALGVYVGLVWVYAWVMDRLDAEAQRPDGD